MVSIGIEVEKVDIAAWIEVVIALETEKSPEKYLARAMRMKEIEACCY
jgi:hypothetical protein